MKTKLATLIVLFIALSFVDTFAQHRVRDSVQYVGSAILPLTVNLSTPNYPSQTYPASVSATTNLFPLNTKIKSAKLFAVLDAGDRYVIGSSAFTASVSFNVVGQGTSSSVVIPGSATSYVIEINNKVPKQYKLIDFSQNVADVKQFQISIASKTINSSSLPVYSQTELANNIRIKFYYEIEYFTDVRTSSGIPTPIINNLNPIFGSKVHEFNWSSTPYNFPNYQFELLRLYNTDVTINKDLDKIITKIDWSKALKIETQSADKKLKISIAEGTGFYIWRVRGIGNYYEGEIANFQNWGAWSSSPADGATMEIKKSHITGGVNSICYFTDHEEHINWIYSRTFTEGNRISEKISYANTLQQQKQVQAHLPSGQIQGASSQGVTVVSQTENDFSGRPSLTTMPVPVAENSLQGFKSTFVTTAVNTPIRPEAFDLSTNYTNVTIDSSGAFGYYSDNNNDLSIPSASGYPYTRTLFYSDGTGRVKEQSGFGKIHAIGKQTDGKGRTTRTLYATPSQDELIRVFGDEAPDAASVFKTITIDPNNTQSVAYTSKEGKVIATCLIKNINNGLSEINATNYTTFTSNNSIDRNTLVPGGFISAKRLSFATPTSTKIAYQMNCNDFTACPGNLTTCNYKVQIYIHDLKRNLTYEFETPKELNECNTNGFKTLKNTSYTTNGSIYASEWVNKATGDLLDGDQNVPRLEEGDYLIEKYIYADAQSQLATYESVMEKVEKNVKPVITQITDMLQAVTNETQLHQFYGSLQTIMDNFKTQTAAYNENVPTSYTAFSTVLVQPENVLTYDVRYIAAGQAGGPSYPKQINIKIGCCNSFSIPIRYSPPIVCYTQAELKSKYLTADPYTYPLDFEEYAKARLTKTDAELQELLPGFDIVNKHELNGMVYHMLTDKYLAGNSIYDSGTRLELVLGANGLASYTTAINTANDTVQYKCEDLWKCWISVVNQLELAQQLDFDSNEGKDQLDIMNGADASNDQNVDANDDPVTNDKDSSTESNTVSDDNAEKSPGVFKAILNWIVNRNLRKELHKKRDGKAGNEALPNNAFKANLANLFLDCAGRRFAEILSSTGTASTPTFYTADATGDFAYTPLTTQPVYTYTDRADKYIYPYVLDPKWGFKYFVYNPISPTITDAPSAISSTSLSATYTNSISYLPLEFDFCVEKVPTNLCEMPKCYSLMGSPTTYTYKNWSTQKRIDFYQELLSYSLPKPISNDDMTVDGNFTSPTACPTTADLNTKLAETIGNCNSDCDKRKGEIRNKLVQLYLDNCYVLEGCASNSNVITLNDIDKIVDAVVTDCKTSCDLIFARATQITSITPLVNYSATEQDLNVPDPLPVGSPTQAFTSTSAYPKTYVKGCLNYKGNEYVTVADYCVGFILPRCELEHINQINYWSFQPYLPPSMSKCSKTAEQITNNINIPVLPAWFLPMLTTINSAPVCSDIDKDVSNLKKVEVSLPVTQN